MKRIYIESIEKSEDKMKNKLKNTLIYVGIFLVISIGMIFMILLKNINPETSNLFPPCIVYKLTGIKCAGCGITRALHQIFNLNFKEAFILNPLIFVYAILVVYLIIRIVILKIQKKDIISILQKEIQIILYIALFVTVIFMVLRNIIKM